MLKFETRALNSISCPGVGELGGMRCQNRQVSGVLWRGEGGITGKIHSGPYLGEEQIWRLGTKDDQRDWPCALCF